MSSSSPFFPVYPTTIQPLLDEHSTILLVGSSLDQGETAAVIAAGTGFLKKISKSIHGFVAQRETFKHLHFLSSFEDITTEAPTENFLSSAVSHQIIIFAFGITRYEDLPEFVKKIRAISPKTPLINIDRQKHNTAYGTINIIDTKASAVSEILYHVLSAIDPKLIDDQVATALLTSMIIATKSFRSGHVRPESLALASHLVERGAERETIIHHLYRSRSLPTLRLWGRALARLKNNPYGLVTTIITREDILSTGAQTAEIHGVADELLANAPEAKVTLLLYEDLLTETTGLVHGLLSSEHHFSCLTLSEHLKGNGHERRTVFSVPFFSAELAETHLTKDLSDRIKLFSPTV